MKHNSIEVWRDFKASFAKSIEETPFETLKDAWQSSTNRTEFYLDQLLPNVAKKLSLSYEREKTFRVDGILSKIAKTGYPVPIIFVESENNSGDTETEIYKLCCLNSPLKVLLICCEWTDEYKLQTTNDYWQYIIDSFVAENTLVGHLGIIVAEMKDSLKFFGFAYNEQGKIEDNEQLICEIC
jgi:hypothetical protein